MIISLERKYNHTTYVIVKKTNAVLRDKLSPDPADALKVFGVIGKVIGFIIKKIIAFPIHLIAFAIAGLFYNKGKDRPCKGSFIYTGVFIGLMGVVGLIIKVVVDLIQA